MLFQHLHLGKARALFTVVAPRFCQGENPQAPNFGFFRFPVLLFWLFYLELVEP